LRSQLFARAGYTRQKKDLGDRFDQPKKSPNTESVALPWEIGFPGRKKNLIGQRRDASRRSELGDRRARWPSLRAALRGSALPARVHLARLRD